jgi:NAD(P)-dependent dehydrogenase (short-subunit alcohol dehydrogenase family)
MTIDEGTVAFVTGGTRGFGRALVDELLARGASRVYAASRSGEPGHPDPRVVTVPLDVTDVDAVLRAAADAGDVTLVVNNAGTSHNTSVLHGPLDDIRLDLETNVYGLINVSRAFAPVLARQGGGALVNVLSALSWLSGHGGYGVSKAAALSATNALRLELLEQGTVVTALHVCYMETDMIAGLGVENAADPSEIARVTLDGVEAGALEVLADDTARYVKSRLSGELAELYPSLVTA